MSARNRVYERKFDWDEARKLRAEGISYEKIGQQLGVSTSAIMRVVNPEQHLRFAAAGARYQTSGTCIDCGAPCSHRPSVPDRCWECWADARATSVREDELLCHACHEWKPDDAFPWLSENATGTVRRRGRRSWCRACDNQKRSERRRRAARAET